MSHIIYEHKAITIGSYCSAAPDHETMVQVTLDADLMVLEVNEAMEMALAILNHFDYPIGD